MRRTAAAGALLLAACGACWPGRAPAPSILAVSVSSGTLTAPDSARAGWTRLRVEEDGGGHIVVIFRIPDSLTPADLKALRMAMDTSRATPRDAVAYGGPEVGDSGEVTLYLTPARYLIGCVSRGEDGHRHLAGGEWKVMDVLRSRGRRASEPLADHEVRMVDFAYAGEATWPAGEQVIQVVNRGRQEHQLRIDRLHPGVSLQAWLTAADSVEVSTPVAGAARMGPRRTVFLPVSLEPGAYVIYCLVPDYISGRMHVELGMFRAIKVE